jgi:hypothetical protein
MAIRDAGIRAGKAVQLVLRPLAPFHAGLTEFLLTHLASHTPEEPSNLVLKTTDFTASGSTDAFLSSRLRFTTDSNGQHICLVKINGDEVGVMMGWERGISGDLFRIFFYFCLI